MHKKKKKEEGRKKNRKSKKKIERKGKNKEKEKRAKKERRESAGGVEGGAEQASCLAGGGCVCKYCDELVVFGYGCLLGVILFPKTKERSLLTMRENGTKSKKKLRTKNRSDFSFFRVFPKRERKKEKFDIIKRWIQMFNVLLTNMN